MTPQDMADLHGLCFTTPRPWTAQEFAETLHNPLTRSFILGHSFALIRCIADEAEVLTLATHPDHRRKGMAQSLLQVIHSQPDLRTVFLEVAADNDAAQALYTAHGYTESGKRVGYYRAPNGDRLDALVLQKTLT